MNRWANGVNELMSRYESWKKVWWDDDYRLDFGEDFGEGEVRRRLEANTAYSAFGLAEIGALDRLSKCICEKWFIARRSSQKSCSSLCRHRLYEQTPAAKANRREYMKKYNRLIRNANVK